MPALSVRLSVTLLILMLAVARNARGDGIYAWGDNVFGQLGNGTDTMATLEPAVATPVPCLLSSGVAAIAAGANTSLAIQDGALYSWGRNYDGELGNGTFNGTANSVPTPVPGMGTGVTTISMGGQRSSDT